MNWQICSIKYAVHHKLMIFLDVYTFSVAINVSVKFATKSDRVQGGKDRSWHRVVKGRTHTRYTRGSPSPETAISSYGVCSILNEDAIYTALCVSKKSKQIYCVAWCGYFLVRTAPGSQRILQSIFINSGCMQIFGR